MSSNNYAVKVSAWLIFVWFGTLCINQLDSQLVLNQIKKTEGSPQLYLSHWPLLHVNACNFDVLFLSTSFIMASMSLSVGFIPNMAAAFINSRRDNLPSPFKSILWKDSFISKIIKKKYTVSSRISNYRHYFLSSNITYRPIKGQ